MHAWKLFGNDAGLVFLDILVHREENLEVAWEMPKQTESQTSLADQAIAFRRLFAAWTVTGQEQKGLNEHPCTGYVPILSEGNLYPCMAGTAHQDRQYCRETEELAVHLNNFFLMNSGTVQQTQGSWLSYCRVPSPQGTGRKELFPRTTWPN